MTTRGLFCFTLLIYSYLCAFAQSFPVSNYNTSNGLINNRTGTAVQDGSGYMWFGTDDGICNYDGRQFRFFPGTNSAFYFAHSYTNRLGDSVVFSTYRQGIAICYRNNIRYITFPGSDTVRINSVLPLGDNRFLIASVHRDGLRIVNGNKVTIIPMPASFTNRIIEGFFIARRDRAGNIWVASDQGVIIFPKGDFSKPFFPKEFANKWINAINEDASGNMYVICDNSISRVLAGELASITAAQAILFYGNHKSYYSSIAFDGLGHTFIGSLGDNGLVVLDKEGRKVAVVNPEAGLPNIMVWDVSIDRENNAWICTDNGLSRFNSIFFRNYPVVGNDHSHFKAGIFYDDSLFLAGNGATVFTLKNGVRKTIRVIGIDTVHIGYVEERFFRASNGQLYFNLHDIPDNPVQHTRQATLSDDKLILGADVRTLAKSDITMNLEKAIRGTGGRDFFLDTKRKLWMLKGNKFYPARPASQWSGFSRFDAITIGNNGELWVSNNDEGVMQLKLTERDTMVIIDTVCFLPMKNPTTRSSGNRLLVDRSDAVWLTSAGNLGVMIFRKDNAGKYYHAGSINTERFDNRYIREIEKDDRGFIYIGTNFGIYRIDSRNNQVNSIESDVFGQYLTGKYIYFLRYKQGQLYIGTTGSLGVVNLDKVVITHVAPPVYITGIQVNSLQSDSLLKEKSVVLSPSSNTIAFTFTSPTFINEKQVAFKYLLEGVDKEWSVPSPSNTATYSELRPGKYTLFVLAQNANGVWSKEPARFDFTIRSPFYQRTWFIALCILLLIGIIFLINRFQLSKALAVANTRQRISKDLHDDVGSTLSSITLMNAVLKKKIQTNPDDAIALAEKVEDTSREMIQSMSDIVWSINPGNDGAEKLNSRLHQFAGTMFEPRGIEYKLDLSNGVTDRHLDMEMRRDIYLICKEIMNNSAKYSQGKYFRLTFRVVKDVLEITAMDDGKGFDPSTVKKGNGLINITQRIHHHRGSCILTSNEEGTHWAIRLPLTG